VGRGPWAGRRPVPTGLLLLQLQLQLQLQLHASASAAASRFLLLASCQGCSCQLPVFLLACVVTSYCGFYKKLTQLTELKAQSQQPAARSFRLLFCWLVGVGAQLPLPCDQPKAKRPGGGPVLLPPCGCGKDGGGQGPCVAVASR
jgi:hypothetical protein